MDNNGIPRWIQNKINKLEQRKLIVRPDVAKNIEREIDQLNQKYQPANEKVSSGDVRNER